MKPSSDSGDKCRLIEQREDIISILKLELASSVECATRTFWKGDDQHAWVVAAKAGVVKERGRRFRHSLIRLARDEARPLAAVKINLVF